MKKKVIITHYDRGVSSRSVTISGRTEKELIYDLLGKTDEWPLFVLRDDHPYIVATFDGNIPFVEAEPLLEFNTFAEFVNMVENSTGYRIEIN